MQSKFDIYDILGILIPGTLLVCLISQLFPAVVSHCGAVKYPDGFAVIALLALSIFVGHVIQAVASILEPLLHISWGGRPSDRALSKGLGDRYLPGNTASRIRERLESVLGKSAGTRSLYLYAVQRAEGVGRVGKFNSLYAYHRAVLTALILSLVMLSTAYCWGCAADWPRLAKGLVFVGVLLIIVILWYRSKQRAFYYVREVLLTVEHILEGKQSAQSYTDASETGSINTQSEENDD